MDDPNMHAYGEEGPDDAEIGRQWRENSSLEKWFPLTAERLAALEAENEALKTAYRKMRNSAAGYSNYCEEGANTRRCDREYEEAEGLFRAIKAAQAAKERT